MKDIAIYGAGGFGKEVACLIKRINEASERPLWNIIGFFDDGKKKGDAVSHFGEVLGGINEINAWDRSISIAMAIGKPITIKNALQKIVNSNANFPNLIDPRVTIVDLESFKIGQGNIIQSGSFFSCDVEIGDFNILNGTVVLGHDCKLGNYNVLMPNIRISGEVTIGNENLIGASSTIIQGIRIGNNITLGAGGVLLTKPKDGKTYIGNPAKLFKY